MDTGANMESIRSSQLDDVSTNVDPVNVTLTTLQQKAPEIYYVACSKIKRDNRYRQESSDIEKKLQTH